MANDLSFLTPSGEAVGRELMILYMNTGTNSSPVWSPIGKRAEDSSMEMDWSKESKKDVLGNTFNSAKKPIITQTFDPCPLDAGDAAQVKLWNLAVREQNHTALMAQDLLLVHFYAGSSESAAFAERYAECSVLPTSLGGEGGGFLSMPIEVTFGGERTVGVASRGADKSITFTADGVGS